MGLLQRCVELRFLRMNGRWRDTGLSHLWSPWNQIHLEHVIFCAAENCPPPHCPQTDANENSRPSWQQGALLTHRVAMLSPHAHEFFFEQLYGCVPDEHTKRSNCPSMAVSAHAEQWSSWDGHKVPGYVQEEMCCSSNLCCFAFLIHTSVISQQKGLWKKELGTVQICSEDLLQSALQWKHQHQTFRTLILITALYETAKKCVCSHSGFLLAPCQLLYGRYTDVHPGAED
ncbi:uncharacterized protein LOC122169806 isoform X3 [Centrocercus urophasianus]|uniref:uncharacterized protein LOC122169806 isoform X3 n=1 Tax=Centrocercus urophasianus TaxID=9002 RepID=UPI001C64874F|nr:uncharacterized protein LOC122169806 isoform X3 [Centrocercus urophasianus]